MQYHVRAAVHRQDAVDTIPRGTLIQDHISSGALKFALVPDNTKPGAYYHAARDCSHIVHVGSPLPTVPGDLTSQAFAGNRAILEAAEVTLTVKRVVFTASISSIRPVERVLPSHPSIQAIMSGKGEDVATLTADTEIPTEPPISEDAPGFHRYVHSKTSALNYIREYVVSHRFHFSIVNIMPGWVIGPKALARNKQDAFKGSNCSHLVVYGPEIESILWRPGRERSSHAVRSGTSRRRNRGSCQCAGHT